jgi:YVTN family beta-propeller protein
VTVPSWVNGFNGVPATGAPQWIVDFFEDLHANAPAWMRDLYPLVVAPIGHVYATNTGDNTLKRIDLSTGLVDQTTTISYGPKGLCWDRGSYICIATDADTVVRVDKSTGVVHDAITVAANALSCEYDGVSNILAAVQVEVAQIRISDGTVTRTAMAGDTTTGICVDGSGHIYATNNHDNTVSIFNRSDLAALGTVSVGSSPTQLCWDGLDHVVVANSNGSTLSRIKTSTLLADTSFSSGIESDPRGICLDSNGNLFVSCYSGHVQQVNPATGAVNWSLVVPNQPSWACADGRGNVYFCASGNVSCIKSGTQAVAWTVAAGNYCCWAP